MSTRSYSPVSRETPTNSADIADPEAGLALTPIDSARNSPKSTSPRIDNSQKSQKSNKPGDSTRTYISATGSVRVEKLPDEMIYHKNSMSERWILLALIMFVVAWSFLLAAGKVSDLFYMTRV
jgi:hypothetical protein